MNYRVEYRDQNWIASDIEAASPVEAAKLYLRQDSEKKWQDYDGIVVHWGPFGRQSETFLIQDILPSSSTEPPPLVIPGTPVPTPEDVVGTTISDADGTWRVDGIEAIGSKFVVFRLLNLKTGQVDRVLKAPHSHFDPATRLEEAMSEALSPGCIPSLVRRGAAKAIDFIAVAFTVVGFSSVTHSYLAGVLIGYAWLALSDWFGSLGKWVMKLAVRDHGTGGECSAWASMVRNLPIIAFALPHRLHQALLGMDRQQYREAYPAVILSMACLALIALAAMLTGVFRNAERRHIGDYLARTVVVSRKRETTSGGQPSP